MEPRRYQLHEMQAATAAYARWLDDRLSRVLRRLLHEPAEEEGMTPEEARRRAKAAQAEIDEIIKRGSAEPWSGPGGHYDLEAAERPHRREEERLPEPSGMFRQGHYVYDESSPFGEKEAEAVRRVLTPDEVLGGPPHPPQGEDPALNQQALEFLERANLAVGHLFFDSWEELASRFAHLAALAAELQRECERRF